MQFAGSPSIRYDANVNGAPAKPISGTSPSASTSSPTASCTGADPLQLEAFHRRHISFGAHRVGDHRADVGHDIRSMPAPRSGTTMSENRIATSTPWRRTGCSA